MHATLVTLSDLSVLSLEPPGWGGVLLAGFLNSIYIAIGGYALGLAIGLFGAAGKLYGGLITRDLLEIYTTVVRAVPELVLILRMFLSRFFFKDKTPHFVILVKDWMKLSSELDSMKSGIDPNPPRARKPQSNSILSKLPKK